MSRNQRLGLVALAVIVAVAAFVIAKPGEEQEQGDRAAAPATEATAPQTSTTERATEPKRPEVKRIVIRNGQPVGGVRDLRFTTGETARIEISSDAADELHLHGYDITSNAKPDRPAKFRFEASAEGSFELESHTAEDAGLNPLVANVIVEPRS